jgi:peptidoglycan/xylan/chitin deacetylase (PgdA/CDA1 family)/GT2 family glycosyltransferase
MSGVPRVSVVVPTLQRRELVRALLDGLARQDVVAPFEAIVVVDGSTDGTAKALEAASYPFDLAVIEQDRSGAATARNRGAERARGEVLLFLDDDMEPDDALLKVHLEAHDDGADVVVGAMPVHPDSPDSILTEGVREWADELAERCARPGYRLEAKDLFTGQLSVARALFEELGGFDQRFTAGGTFGNEDVDFAHRVVERGCSIVFRPDAVSRQRYVVTARELLERATQVGGADVAATRLHREAVAGLRAWSLLERPTSWRARSVLAFPIAVRGMMVPLRAIAVVLVDRGLDDGITRRLFAQLHFVHYWLGVAAAGGPLDGDVVRVLCWHAIADLRGDPVLEAYGVPPARFRRQLATLLTAGWTPITVDELLGFVLRGDRVPRRSVFLTFDDGYEDLATEVGPALTERGLGGVAFVVSSLLGAENRWDIKIGARPMKLADAGSLKRLAGGHLEIAAHSRTHARLPLLDDEELEDEVAGSRTELERLGFPTPRLFSYPGGEQDARVRRATRAAGFEAAFTVLPARAIRGRVDPFAIPRLELSPKDVGRELLRRVRRCGPKPWHEVARDRVVGRVRSAGGRARRLVRTRLTSWRSDSDGR